MTPAAAVVSAALSLACCLPFALPAALGLAGLGAVLGSLRPWLMTASLVLLVAGLIQIYRRRACGSKSTVSLVVLGVATLIVLGSLLFPQLVASVGASSPSASGSSTTPQLRLLDAVSVSGFKDEFNRAEDSIRIVLLLSPT
jgi:hypothetical protein